MKKRFLYRTVFASLIASLTILLFVPSSAYADDHQCQKVTTPVTLSASENTEYSLVGWLCWKGTVEDKTVQLLIHGLTYDHLYWDFPYKANKYSYVRQAAKEGYVTFAIDRLGVGESDKPLGSSLTTASSAYVAHQIVQKLRSGQIGTTPFSKVIMVGHSFGSSTSLYEIGTYHDVDGVILTGHAHEVDPGAFALFGLFYPAALDPKFFLAGLPADYLTTLPGTRDELFYNTAYAESQVIATDEQLKQTATTGELATIIDALNPSLSQSVTVPVLLAMGQQDVLFCNSTTLSCADRTALVVRESQYYTTDACLEAVVQQNSGHDINLHPNAKFTYDAMLEWANRRIGQTNRPPTQPCN